MRRTSLVTSSLVKPEQQGFLCWPCRDRCQEQSLLPISAHTSSCSQAQALPASCISPGTQALVMYELERAQRWQQDQSMVLDQGTAKQPGQYKCVNGPPRPAGELLAGGGGESPGEEGVAQEKKGGA